jgi:hypothetical protein
MFFLLLSVQCCSQQAEKYPARKLLITVEAAQNDQLLIGFIHECLSDLVYENDKERKVYDSIFDSNTIHRSGFVESLIYDLNKPLGQGAPVNFNNPERIKRDTGYQDVLLRFNQVLLIQITNKPQSDIYYYVFTLFSVASNYSEKKAIPVTSLVKSSDCIINITNISYEKILRTTIQQVCRESNISPSVHILSNAVRSPQGYYMAKDDTLSLWLTITDPDTRRARLKCSWTQIESGSNSYPVTLDRFDTVQHVALRNEGVLAFTVKVNDQSADSKLDTFIVHVISRPAITKYFKGSFFRFWKSSGRVTHPFDDLYQPYLFSGHVDIIEFNRHYIWTAGNRPVDIGMVFTDSTRSGTNERSDVSREFKTVRLDTVFMIRQEALIKRPGTFYYHVTLTDHGIKAPPLMIEQTYRKALPFYSGAGFIVGQFKPREDEINLYFTAMCGFFLHPRIHLEYGIDFPLNDSLPGRYYPNHRLAMLIPLPFRFSKKGLLIAIEMGNALLRYPPISKDFYPGLGFGLNIRMLYNTFPWIGTSLRIHYTTLSSKYPSNHFFSVGIGIIILPVRK